MLFPKRAEINISHDFIEHLGWIEGPKKGSVEVQSVLRSVWSQIVAISYCQQSHWLFF